MARDVETFVKTAGRAFAEQLRRELAHWQPTTGPEDLGRGAALAVVRDLRGAGLSGGAAKRGRGGG